ncbi:MAG: hypothetical protein C5S38_06005 [Candidatus Methanophagaceae archaeon]|nr:MAG: hypothetical protein C5S38_06005 [Methanophagales archaeon]KAF5436033.1 hypothetical protein C5S36_01490 [Methanophagales archaeon]
MSGIGEVISTISPYKFLVIALVAFALVCTGYYLILKKRKTLELVPLLIMGTIGFVLIIIGMYLMIEKIFGLSFFTIGIGSFLLLLALMSFLTYLSISSNDSKIQNEKRKKSLLILDKKEIRRSIAISFTILFILLISFYFEKDTSPAAEVITAFGLVYIVIIGVYFGSRVYEKIKEITNAEEVLKIEYILDEIDDGAFRKKMKEIRGIKPNTQLRISETKKMPTSQSSKPQITIIHEGGDAIDLKDVRMIIEVNKKMTRVDPVVRNGKKNIFGEGDVMKIYMDKILGRKSDAVKVNDMPTDVESGDISSGITADWWNSGEEVEVIIIYKPTGKIISEMKREIDP